MDAANMLGAAPPALSVSQLTGQVKSFLEQRFDSVHVFGEISNFSRPQSGHCYFTLKDDAAQIRCVLWRTTAGRLRLALEDGLEVVCSGRLDVYPPRGSYQLVVESLVPKGIGALELALRKLRDRLAAEGLFDPARKKPLPAFPRRIAMVTSPTGAAVRDFLEVLRRRWRASEVLVIPSRVQGDGAAEEIAAGVALAHRVRPPIDVIVVGRGGGSLEDLWAFNEEIVVRAIARSRIPVISAVGHEIDVTLSDLAADVRALTPSEAAERVAPAADELAAILRRYDQRLRTALLAKAGAARARLDAVASRAVFRRPLDRIHQHAQWLDGWHGRATRAIRSRLGDAAMRTAALADRLQALNPAAVLQRGYSITRRSSDGEIIRDAAQLGPDDRMTTQFARGRVTSRVEEGLKKDSPRRRKEREEGSDDGWK
jgi:exodeoxyribonuclease VII large subunit